jgi:predicted hotdog family 3-hydroxylacyl-ACP dehydratase
MNFSPSGFDEHIAQSASAFAGHTAKKNGKPVPIGFIGEVKKFKKQSFLMSAISSILQ